MLIRPTSGAARPSLGVRIPALRCLGVQPPRASPDSGPTRFKPQPTASPVDSLSVHSHCALRCLPLGACVGALESRCERQPPRRVPLAGQPARTAGMISSWPPTRGARRPNHASQAPDARACAHSRPWRASATLASSYALPQVHVARASPPPPAPNA